MCAIASYQAKLRNKKKKGKAKSTNLRTEKLGWKGEGVLFSKDNNRDIGERVLCTSTNEEKISKC